MEKDTLKKEMIRLWKETFQDSNSYIDLIFDNYFNPDNIEFYEENGQLIASLLGVPYFFGRDSNNIKGLYLCGLATRQEYRRRGIMHKLFERIQSKAKKNGFDFVFLIPANWGLRRFYRDLGMSDSFYRVVTRYTSAHDFDRDYLNFLENEDPRVAVLKKNYWTSIEIHELDPRDVILRERIHDFTSGLQQKENPFGLLHSRKDMDAVILENKISRGEILYSVKKNGEITGVVFIGRGEENIVCIEKLYAADRCSYYKLLSAVTKEFPNMSMELRQLPEETSRFALKSVFYSDVLRESPQAGAIGETLTLFDSTLSAESYGMIKFLDIANILKFLAKVRKDSSFSIFVKNSKNGSITHYMSEKGKFQYEEIDKNIIMSMKQPLIMTEMNLSDILCRKPDKNQLMIDAFGLPRLSLNMSLLLD